MTKEPSPTTVTAIDYGKKILFVGAHPDDIEIGAGGTAAKLEASGCKIAFAVASRDRDSQKAAIREEQAKKAAALLNLSEATGNLFFGRISESQFEAETEKVREWLKDISQKFNPDTVFVHRPNEGHTHHQIVSEVAVGCFQQKTVLFYRIPRPPPEPPFEHNHAEDISEHIDSKVQLCACHAGQREDYVGSDSVKTAAHECYNRWFGREMPKENGYAEQFKIHVVAPHVTGALVVKPNTHLGEVSNRQETKREETSLQSHDVAHGPAGANMNQLYYIAVGGFMHSCKGELANAIALKLRGYCVHDEKKPPETLRLLWQPEHQPKYRPLCTLLRCKLPNDNRRLLSTRTNLAYAERQVRLLAEAIEHQKFVYTVFVSDYLLDYNSLYSAADDPEEHKFTASVLSLVRASAAYRKPNFSVHVCASADHYFQHKKADEEVWLPISYYETLEKAFTTYRTALEKANGNPPSRFMVVGIESLTSPDGRADRLKIESVADDVCKQIKTIGGYAG